SAAETKVMSQPSPAMPFSRNIKRTDALVRSGVGIRWATTIARRPVFRPDLSLHGTDVSGGRAAISRTGSQGASGERGRLDSAGATSAEITGPAAPGKRCLTRSHVHATG